MKRDQARLELDATTLRPQDVSQEARAMLTSHPELAAWQSKRRAFDEEVANAFACLPAMAGLKDSILQAVYERPAKRPLRWLAPTAIAAAACVLFGWTLFWPGNSAMAAWESESLNTIAKVEHGLIGLDAREETLEALKKHLTTRECPCPSALPSALTDLHTFGCKRVTIDGHAGTIICFALDSGKEAHLLVLNNEGLCDCPGEDEPCFKSARNWRYASWTHGSHTFLLATTADEAALKRLFGLV
ncbi:MAG: hypothetical protein ACKO8Z_01595 [Prosthecobacter sp.]